ncbi:MAG TPA: peroxiredoxin [Methylomirabilota bacterium]|jgi:peroxiredoxin (alkyl hydroperoxide reductase subunit C)|nr:peroxiredoxin [Methylomirabilota bacterium]
MIGLNAPAPDVALEGIADGKVRRFRLSDFRGRWLVLFFYPADFTFVCPTEIRGFHERRLEFAKRNCEILAVSVDDIDSHRAWAAELGGVAFPLLSDPGRDAARAYGVLNEADGRAFRATFIIDPEGLVAYFVVSPMNVGRSVDETLRVLDALQTGRLCPADWHPGEPTLDPSLRY